MRQIDEIIIHCTATREGRDVTVEELRQWHTLPAPQGNGWSDIGYHFLISTDGTVWACRPLDRAGAHCHRHNANSIGIVYAGGVGRDGRPKDTRTPAQRDALVDILFILMQQYHLGIECIHTHNEYSKKNCPCFSGESIRAELRNYINSL